MVVIMCLEYRGLITHTSAYSIVRGHDLSQLIKGLEDVNSNTSIEPSWLKHPQILIIMAAVREFERRLQCFLFLHLALVQFLIDYIDVLVYVFVNELHDAEELLNSITDIIFQVVEHDRQWDHIINVLLLGFIIRLKVDEQVILSRQVAVALHVVDQLL